MKNNKKQKMGKGKGNKMAVKEVSVVRFVKGSTYQRNRIIQGVTEKLMVYHSLTHNCSRWFCFIEMEGINL